MAKERNLRWDELPGVGALCRVAKKVKSMGTLAVERQVRGRDKPSLFKKR